ncbi:MAG: hypothetical protein ABI790_08650 [Betaproteobacteria bacterium]
MNPPRYVKILQRVLALVALVFGLITVIAGTRVMAGADPGYVVYQPLLIYNTAMGVAYLVAGVMAWRSLARGKAAAAVILALNVLVLCAIGYGYVTGSAVAADSLRAMTFRTVVWLVLFAGLTWLSHRHDLSASIPSNTPSDAA